MGGVPWAAYRPLNFAVRRKGRQAAHGTRRFGCYRLLGLVTVSALQFGLALPYPVGKGRQAVHGTRRVVESCVSLLGGDGVVGSGSGGGQN